MTWFACGLALGLLINRHGTKPLLRFPLRCWFLGHGMVNEGSERNPWRVCKTCRLYSDDAQRFVNTFWTI